MSKPLEAFTIGDFTEKTKDRSSYPGGGAVAALGGALGASLVLMAEALSHYHSEKSQRVENIGKALLENMEEDALAYEKVIEAKKCPKTTQEEIKYRNEKIEEGLIHAIEVPLKTASLALELLEIQEAGITNIFPYGISDTGVATLLLYSALEGALLNVRINVGSLKDENKKTYYKDKMEKMVQDGTKRKEKILEYVYGKL